MIAIIPLFVWEVATGPAPIIDLKTILICLYLAIFPSMLAYICYNRGIQLLGPNRVAALYPTIVAVRTALAIVFLGEQPRWYHLVGSVLIIGGVLHATRNAQAAKTDCGTGSARPSRTSGANFRTAAAWPAAPAAAAHRVQHLRRQFAVDLDQRDGVAAGRLAADMEGRDVDAGLAQRRGEACR